jgi:hypothetical protein
LKERRMSWYLTILKTMILERLPLMCLISFCFQISANYFFH